MNWNKWMRQIHRWFSIIFTVGVIINGVAVARGSIGGWVGLLALLPRSAAVDWSVHVRAAVCQQVGQRSTTGS